MSVTHPMIDRKRNELERELLILDRSYDNAISGRDDEAEERVGKSIDRVERALDSLDMEAADPAAHGYIWEGA